MSTKFENERGYEYYDNHPSCRIYNNSPEPGKALLSCGSGGIGPMPKSSEHSSNPIQVASVSIDTSRLCNPRVLLNFTCVIGLPEDIEVTLNFVIIKTIDCGVPQAIGGTHTFIEKADKLESESFCFQFCDCNPSVGGITYTVKIDPSSKIHDKDGLTITNATLSALAVETLC